MELIILLSMMIGMILTTLTRVITVITMCIGITVRIGMSSTCYTKQNNKERYWIAWTQNGRVIRWGSFCERLRHGSTCIIKRDQHAGLDNLSPLHYAKPHELEDIPSLALW